MTLYQTARADQTRNGSATDRLEVLAAIWARQTGRSIVVSTTPGATTTARTATPRHF